MTLQINLQTIIFAVGILWGLYKGICYIADRYGWGKKRQDTQLYKEADMVIMREIIRWNYSDYVLKNIPIDADHLAHLEQVYDIYTKLGGNGSATRQIEELRNCQKI